jgi:hypothetical protein
MGPTAGEMNQEQLLEYLIAHGVRWVQDQRATHRPSARPLLPEENAKLQLFVAAEVLSNIRVKTVPMIDNPPFYRDLARAGISMPLDFRVMSGITFQDTILISQAARVPDSQAVRLIFHESMHALQYRELGLERFIRQYVLGWAACGFQYAAIPLEVDAYELDARFASSSGTPFDAAAEVRRRLASRGAAA